MLSNFFKVIIRHLLRSKFFAILNIAGLSIGMACCVVIYLFSINELSYDKFHKDGDKIYRVVRESQINGIPYDIGVTSYPYAEAIANDYKGKIEDVTRAISFSGLVRYDDRFFIEDKLLFADKNFFEFFSYPLLKGDPSRVLKDPNTIVVSQEFANKYFGDEDPVGKMIRIEDQYDMLVSGVMDELPGNTHLQFDVVGSMSVVEADEWIYDWWANAFSTYVKVPDEMSAGFLNASFPEFMDKYFGKDFERIGNKIGLKLEPLHDIYFNQDTRYENNVVHGSRRYVIVFVSVGIMLLLLAAINYVNLATAQSSERSKEVGIRKTLGSLRRHVAFQFLSESFLLCFISSLIALGIAQAAIPYFNSSFDLSIPGIFDDVNLWIFLAALWIFISVISGSYPAFLLSTFVPVKVLKGQVKSDFQYLLLRKVLVVFQFSISAFMIIATLYIGSQVNYMSSKDLGFKAEQLMVVKINNGLINREREGFRQELLRHSDFLAASFSSGHPGGFYDASTVQIEGADAGLRMRTLWTDNEFINTMGLSMASGRFFSEKFPADTTSSVVLNESAVRQLGWTIDEALGKRVRIAQFDSAYKQVVGIIRDYHFSSLKEKIEPLIISCDDVRSNLLVKASGDDLSATVERLQKVWDSYETGFPLEFTFVDELINRSYRAEMVQGRIFTIFSILSVVIACLGILGLASYIASQREKEIGIRKVLGASVKQVSLLLMRDLVSLVLIANVIAIPLCYVAIRQWSEGFPYRAPLTPLIFVVGSLAVLSIAVIIVAVNASSAALKNPVTSLRSE